MSPELAWLPGIVSAVLTAFIAAVSVAWFLRGQFSSLERRITRVETSFEQQISRIETSFEQQISKVETSFEQRISRIETSLERCIEEVKASLEGRVDGLAARINGIGAQIGGLRTAVHTLGELVALLTGAVHRSGALSSEDLVALLTRYNDAILSEVPISETVGRAMDEGNPITVEEGERLLRYVERARRGDLFTSQEAEDLYQLSRRVSDESPDDPGAWRLLLLGAFLFGVFVGRKSPAGST